MALFEVQGPDGKTYEVEAPDLKTAISAFSSVANPKGGSQTNPGAVDEFKLKGRAALAGAADTASLGYSDEMSGAMAGVGSVVQGDGYLPAYQAERDRVRTGMADMREQEPGAFFGGQVLGGGALTAATMGVGPTIGAARSAPAIANTVRAAPTLANTMKTGAIIGAGEGGLYGFGSAEGGLGNRVNDGAWGMTLGGLLGGTLPLAGALGKQAVGGVKGARRASRVGSQIADDAGISPQSGRIVSRLMGEGNEDGMKAAMQRAGPNAMLADASPGAGGMLDATMRSPAPGAAIARQRVDDRAGDAYYGVMDALTGGQQGPRVPPVANQTARRTSARANINPLYQKAYDTPINYASPEGQAVEDILTRAPRDLVRKAVKDAQDKMIYDGFPDQQIMARIGDDGAVVFDEMPNTMMADYIKRAFDEVAEDSKDAVTGAMSSDGQFANRVARDLRGALADAVPGYDEALSAASTDIRGRAAVRTGQKLLRPQTTVEEISEAVADSTPAELRAMREGVMGQVDHIMGNVRAVATDQNIDAREAMKLYGELSSGNAKRKMSALFKDQWPEVEAKIDEAGAALGLRARVAGNSSTQPRQVADQMVADEVAPGVVRSLQPIGSVREIGQMALGSNPASVARLSDDVKAEIAEYLTRTGGEGNAAIQNVVNVLKKNPIDPRAGVATQGAINTIGIGSTPALTERLKKALGLQSAR